MNKIPYCMLRSAYSPCRLTSTGDAPRLMVSVSRSFELPPRRHTWIELVVGTACIRLRV